MRVNALDGVEFMSRRLTFGKARVKRYEAPFPGGCVAAYRMLRKAMINRIKLFFSAQNDGAGVESLGSEIQMAVAALMVETALGDGNFGEDERARIERLVGRRFGLEGEAARRLLAGASGRGHAAGAVNLAGILNAGRQHLLPQARHPRLRGVQGTSGRSY